MENENVIEILHETKYDEARIRAEKAEHEKELWKGNAQALAKTVAEVSRYQARFEALERAVEAYGWGYCNNFACKICVKNEHECQECKFQFDEERFTIEPEEG